jgi:hypothetical protein
MSPVSLTRILPHACMHQVERLEARDLDGDEILRRVQICERKVHDVAGSKLSPFNQQQVLSRLEQLEAEARERDAGALGLPLPSQEPNDAGLSSPRKTAMNAVVQLEERLVLVESKVSGVYNLPGKLIAMEHIAENLGIEVPDLEVRRG